MTTKEQVQRLYKQGLRPTEIAKRLGITRQAVVYHLKGLGVVAPRTAVVSVEESRSEATFLRSSQARLRMDALVQEASDITARVQKGLEEASLDVATAQAMLAAARSKRETAEALEKLWRWQKDLLPIEILADRILTIAKDGDPNTYRRIFEAIGESFGSEAAGEGAGQAPPPG